MAENDTNPVNELIRSYFFPGGAGANLKLRERIALAQMAQRRTYPKTFGEGLSAIGDAIGDRGIASRLEADDRSGQKEASAYDGPSTPGALPPTAAPQVRSYAPQDANTVLPPPAPAAAPPLAQQVAPAAGLNPAAAVPPDQQQSYEPGAPVRMSTPEQLNDFRAANPLPQSLPPVPQQRSIVPPPPPPPPPVAIQPQQPDAPALPFAPGGRFDGAFPNRQQSALQPPPGTPVMAGGEPDITEMGPADVASPGQINAGRNALAAAMMKQQATRGGPPPNPTAGAAGPPQTNPAPVIDKAPPQAQIQTPGMPVQPGAVAGWVPERPTTQPRAQPLIPPSAEETALARDLAIRMQINPYMAQSPGAIRLQRMQQDREARQKDLDKVYEAQITRDTEQSKQHILGRMDQPKRIQEYGTGQIEQQTKQLALENAREQSILQGRFGGRDPKEVWGEFDTAREGAKKTAHALTQFTVAQDMIKKGVITGTAQGWKVSLAKVAAAFGDTDAASAISRTEQLQAALKSTLALAVENIQGAGGKVSDTDVRIAEGTIGADPALQLETIKSLVTRGEQAAHSKIARYNTEVDTYLGGTRAAPRYRVEAPKPEDITPPPAAARIREFRNEAEAAAASRSIPKNADGKRVVRINGRLAEID